MKYLFLALSILFLSPSLFALNLDFTETLLQEWGQFEPAIDKDFRNNISAVECNDDRSYCLLGADEKNFILLAKYNGHSYQMERLIDLPTINGKKSEIDIEAAAYDGQFFYITGSHGVSRKKAKEKVNRHAVYRLKIDKNGQNDQILVSSFDKIIRRVPEINDSLLKPLQHNGVNIEGLAILDQTFYIGFRGPLDRNTNPTQAYILSVPIDDVFDPKTTDYNTHLFRLKLDSDTGIRGMATWKQEILILGGDSAPTPKRRDDGTTKDKYVTEYKIGSPYSIYSWNPGMNAKKIRDLKPNEVAEHMKVEAIFSFPMRGGDFDTKVEMILEGENQSIEEARSFSVPFQ